MALSNLLADLLAIGFMVCFVVAPPSSPPRKVSCYSHGNRHLSIYNYSMYDVNRENIVKLSKYSGKQEPGANGTEILNTLKYVRPGRGFVPNFPLLEKSEVNGEHEIPLYTYLKSVCPPDIDTFFTENCRIFYHPIRTRDVHYNFEKFLINKRGKPVLRFSHNYPPDEIQRDIYTLLQED